MTDDERQAQIILSRWIHKVTGTSEAERGLRKAGEEFRRFGAALQEVFAPLVDFIGKGTK